MSFSFSLLFDHEDEGEVPLKCQALVSPHGVTTHDHNCENLKSNINICV
jgi:hypothetical protein